MGTAILSQPPFLRLAAAVIAAAVVATAVVAATAIAEAIAAAAPNDKQDYNPGAVIPAA